MNTDACNAHVPTVLGKSHFNGSLVSLWGLMVPGTVYDWIQLRSGLFLMFPKQDANVSLPSALKLVYAAKC